MAKTVRELIEILEQNGWEFIPGRGKGSHRLYAKKGHRPIPVPGKLSDTLQINTEKSIMKRAVE